MKSSRWVMVVLGVIAFLMVGTAVWASPPSTGPSVPPLATPGLDADKVDGHHAGPSNGSASQRANNVLWAMSNGRLSLQAMPGALNSRYVNRKRADTMTAASAGALLTLHNTGSGGALRIPGAGGLGIEVVSANQSGIKVNSAGHDGIWVNSASWSGVYVASSGADALRVQTAGQDGLRFFDGMGRDYIRAGNDGALEFRLMNGGDIRMDGNILGPADFAELMSAEGEPATYEAGDVLVISAELDRTVGLSSEPYSTMVIGVYSEKPGIVGSPHPMEDQRDDEIAVAVVGIVSCKVSAENGAIRRGDLLVTSSTPGHAMRVDNPAPGTILGKALEPLEEGRGVILVLVTLQ